MLWLVWWHPCCINMATQTKLLFTRPADIQRRSGLCVASNTSDSPQKAKRMFLFTCRYYGFVAEMQRQYHYFRRSRDRRNVPHISIREYSYANGRKFPHSEPGFARRPPLVPVVQDSAREFLVPYLQLKHKIWKTGSSIQPQFPPRPCCIIGRYSTSNFQPTLGTDFKLCALILRKKSFRSRINHKSFPSTHHSINTDTFI